MSDTPAENPLFPLLRAVAGAGGVLDYGAFTALALHHPEHGYYRKNRRRVGREDGTDFYTAASLGPLFGRLVRAAAVSLLGAARCRSGALVEIGAEPGQNLFAAEKDFFAQTSTIRNGEPLAVPPAAVVFANELLDAQPFHRLVFHAGRWRELGVRLANGTVLAECLLEDFSGAAARDFAATLPVPWHEGWVVDAPLGAEALLRELTARSWTGALVFFDYGKTLGECLESSPGGTARAYRRHRQHNDLLADPGEQDLTCHVLWDRLEAIVTGAGFSQVRVERQEAFFMRRAAAEIAAVLETPDAGLEQERSRLRSLIHPAHFGHKFQVLSAVR